MTRTKAIINLVVSVSIALFIAYIAAGEDLSFPVLIAYMFGLGGIPSGWLIVRKWFRVRGWQGLLFVFVLSGVIGVFAFPIGIIKDIYYIIVNIDPADMDALSRDRDSKYEEEDRKLMEELDELEKSSV